MKRVDKEREANEAFVSLANFAESYNKILPPRFPRASEKILKQFQTAYPTLFKNGDSWSIDKHRKRLMDWLASHRDIA